MDIQQGGVQDHFPQNVLKFGFGDWKNVDEKRRPNPIFPKIPEKLDVWMGEMGKKSIYRQPYNILKYCQLCFLGLDRGDD